MINHIDIINKVLSLGTILIQVIILFLSVILIFFRSKGNKVLFFFKRYTIPMGFLISLGAVAISLFYSEIVGYPPCELCWIQRILLYPQLVFFIVDIFYKKYLSIIYSFIFASLGVIVSLYHVYIENGGTKGLSCATLNPENINQVSCAIRYIYEFGYITIPVMSLTIFLFILMLIFNYKQIAKS